MLTRRSFMSGAACAAAAAGALRAAGANDRIRVGVVGVRGRRTPGRGRFPARADAEVACICDVDSRLFAQRAAAIEKTQRKKPAAVQDLRELLDDKSLDAAVIATPDHWHALATILACQAGKDVYVEKPASHNAWEGRRMVAAARKYGRVVQLGTQGRSAPYAKQALEYIKGGGLGRVRFMRVYNMKHRGTLADAPDGDAPDGVDYDRWLGPAPARRFNPNHFYGGAWNWKWEYSGGDIVNDGVHQLDLARWFSQTRYPRAVACAAAILHLADKQATPDTQVVTYEYDDLIMTFEMTLWTPYMRKSTDKQRDADIFPFWQLDATKIEIYGSDRIMVFGRHGDGWQVWNRDGTPGPFGHGRQSTAPHIQNFIECMWSRARPAADIEEGHLSTFLCHLGNISHRVGGRRLVLDGETETFVGDAEANALLTRKYRPPYVVPETV